jgi:hypothetical protein
MAALALIGLALRSFGVADSNGLASPSAEILAFVVGVWLPLFALVYAVSKRRHAGIAIAFCVGLSVNVLFLTHAVPAAALTDNSSIFTFANSSNFDPPRIDMEQHYSPTSSTATTCPGSAGYSWVCSWASDSFAAGRTLEAGTAQADLYLSNNPVPVLRSASNLIGGSNNVCTLTKPANLADGDVMLAACRFRGGTGTTVTSVPSGWSLVGSRVDNGTTISLVVYSHVVTTASSEPASYTWDLSGTVKYAPSLIVFSGIDSAAPVDADAGSATASGTSHDAPSVTTTVSSDALVTYHVTATCTNWTPPAGMTEHSDTTFCSQSAGSNVDMETSSMRLGAAGATGPLTATNADAADGVTKTIALRRSTAPMTCDLTVQVMKPVQHRSTDSNAAADTTSLVINTPGGVQDGDVMVATIGARWTTGFTITAPAGWTLVGSGTNGGCCTMSVYTKAASSEPANYTWTFSASTAAAGGISAYWNVDTVTTYDVQGGNASSGLNATTPVITTTQPAELLVASFMSAAIGTWTPPTGMTERFDRNASGALTASVEQADVIQTLAGAVSKTATITASSSGSTHIVALRSAAGAGYLGSATAQVTSPASATLVSVALPTAAVSFSTEDRLQLDVIAPNDQVNCAASLSYDSVTTPSRLTLATVVPEGIGSLLLLAPALPFAARWWKRRRP